MEITNRILEEQEKYAKSVQDKAFGKHVVEIAKKVCSHLRLEELFQVNFVESAPEMPLKASWSGDLNTASEQFLEEFLNILGAEISLELTHKGIVLVRNSQKTTQNYDVKETLKSLNQAVKDAIQNVAVKTGNKAEWIIISPDLVYLLGIETCQEDVRDFGYFNIFKVGKLDDVTVYANALFPATSVLIGNRQGFKVNFNKVVKSQTPDSNYHRLSCDVEYEMVNPNNYALIHVEAMGRVIA